MTLDDIKIAVGQIKSISGDDERAHGEEDYLHQTLLRFIAESGVKDISDMAAEALKTQDIAFSRWCA